MGLSGKSIFLISKYARASKGNHGFIPDGDALIWFQDAEQAGDFASWEVFVKVVHIRFGVIAYDDSMEALTRLKQVSFVVVTKVTLKFYLIKSLGCLSLIN